MNISPKEKLVDDVFGSDPVLELLGMSIGMQATFFEVVRDQRRNLRILASRGCQGKCCRKTPTAGEEGTEDAA